MGDTASLLQAVSTPRLTVPWLDLPPTPSVHCHSVLSVRAYTVWTGALVDAWACTDAVDTQACLHTYAHMLLHTCTRLSQPARFIGGSPPAARSPAHMRVRPGNHAPAAVGRHGVTASARGRMAPPSTLRGRPAPEASDLNLKTLGKGRKGRAKAGSAQTPSRPGVRTAGSKMARSGLRACAEDEWCRLGACADRAPAPAAPTVPSAGPRPDVRGAALPSSSSDSLPTTSISAESSEPFPRGVSL